MERIVDAGRVLVACPDARPPAYQAVIGLDRAGLLGRFMTAGYYHRDGRLPTLARRLAPAYMAGLERILLRRHDAEIPADRVRALPTVDLAVRLESHWAGRRPRWKRALAHWRTERFDAALARAVAEAKPEALVAFSDVASTAALPLCRRLGIPTVLSMVHGDVREERRVLEEEACVSPDFLPLYLGSGQLDLDELAWLHERRLRDLELADRIAVPSIHIAQTLARHGIPPARLRVIPYAADCRRFQPRPRPCEGAGCTFLFAGGICQRKGIKYLLEAWRAIRRPGWTLRLLGPLPVHSAPLASYLPSVELAGRVAHHQMPEHLAAADVFVFPSLFEGSAVVTYEALACGLPSIVTPSAGSVVRDGVDGFVVPARDVNALAARMEQLGSDRALRGEMGRAARAQALAFDWPRYHASLVSLVQDLTGGGTGAPKQSDSRFGSAATADTGAKGRDGRATARPPARAVAG
jgi:glycosyltransferase involved in cell wall biosynthesis